MAAPTLYVQISFDLPMELMKKGCDWKERAVYVEAIIHCRDELTDGVIRRSLLMTWMPDLPAKQRAKVLDAMTAKSALAEHSDGWAFPEHVWAAWGRNKADVEAKKEEKSRAGAKGNHARWHIGPDREPDPDCEWCIAEGIAPASQGATQVRSQDHRRTIARGQRQRPENRDTSRSTTTTTGTAVLNESSVVVDELFDQTVELAVDDIAARTTVRKPRAWRKSTRANVVDELGPAIRLALSLGRTPEQAAREVAQP